MKARILLALHFHQPIGNFDSVFRDAVRLCYAPLLDHFERHPGVGAAFHLSGCLIEWLEAHDRRCLDRVLALVGTGRIEPLGGAFYEPILTAVPREDALEQIDRLGSWWERRCGRRPAGAWIAERVWEPGLAEVLAEAGVRYTILDDQHLRFAGLLDDRFSGLFVTERSGRAVGFFPSDFRLRYLIPFRTVEAVREHLDALPDGRDWTLTYGDDAEKFGLWPGTHEWVYGEEWLEKFLRLLEEEDGPARALSPGAFLDTAPPARKVYVPNASYTEMLEWALPARAAAAYGATRRAALAGGADPESVRAFVRGSLWDMFLARYPEADQMHKHVLWTSARVRALPPEAIGRDLARTAVLRAECNCAYWHGLFGGIYFPHLRQGVSGSLLEADAILARDLGGRVVVETLDLDGDLETEVILRSETAQAFLRPADGGSLAELDLLEPRFNVTNVMSRWKEAYHEGADQTHAPEARGEVASPHERPVGLGDAALRELPFDTSPLRSLRDFVCERPPAGPGLARFDGLVLLRGRLDRWETDAGGLAGRACLAGVTIDKSITMDPSGSLRVRYQLERPEAGASGPPPSWFGTLLFLTLLTGEDRDRALVLQGASGRASRHPPGEEITAEAITSLALEDRVFGFALDIEASPGARLATTPIQTLQRTEDRPALTYQGTIFALCWPLARDRDGAILEAGLRIAPRRLAP
jgi:hypothetical protein